MAQYIVVSADTLIKRGGGKLIGFLCTAASGGSEAVTVYDSTAASGNKIIDALTPVAGTFYSLSLEGVWFSAGLYFDVTGTVKFTVVYE